MRRICGRIDIRRSEEEEVTTEPRPKGAVFRKESHMRYPLCALAVSAGFALTAGQAIGQTASAVKPAVKIAPVAASKNWTQPKTPWGDPDLQGTWTDDDCIGTPTNRPAEFGDRGFYTEQELADRENRLEEAASKRSGGDRGQSARGHWPSASLGRARPASL